MASINVRRDYRNLSMRLRRPLIAACLTLMLLLAPGPGTRGAGAYEGEHYAWTYFLALELGFTKRQAYQIASGAYALDWDPHTSPMEATPGDAIFGADHTGFRGTEHPELAGIWRDFHAFADENVLGKCGLAGKDLLGTIGPTLDIWSRLKGNTPLSVGLVPIIGPHLTVGEIEELPECTLERKMAIFAVRQKRRDELWQLAVREQNPGPLIHFVQDYYAHFQYTNFRGHALAGHCPDFMSWNRDNAVGMTNDTLGVLLEFRDYLGTFAKEPAGNLLRQKPGVPDINHIFEVMGTFMAANPAPSATTLDRLLKEHPDVTLYEVGKSPKWTDITAFDPSGELRNAPDLGAYVAVVNKAIQKDEEAGLLQKWPEKVDQYHWMPPKWSQYSYTSTGHIEQPEQSTVEKVELEFGTQTVNYKPLDQAGSAYQVSMSLPYKISGLAEILRSPTDNYLRPLPAIEHHELGSNLNLPKPYTEYSKQLSNGNYTATYETELKRKDLESGNWSWDVSVQLYGYEPKTKKVPLSLPYKACPPKGGKLLETVKVLNEWPGFQADSANSLENGKCYTIDVRGERLGSDAIYCFAGWRCGANRGQALEELKLAGSGLLEGSMGPIAYQQDHHYQVGYIGQGKRLAIGFSSADDTGEMYKKYRETEKDGCRNSSPGCYYEVEIRDPDIPDCGYEIHDHVLVGTQTEKTKDLWGHDSPSFEGAVADCKQQCDDHASPLDFAQHTQCTNFAIGYMWINVVYPGQKEEKHAVCSLYTGDVLPFKPWLTDAELAKEFRPRWNTVGIRKCTQPAH